MPFIGRFGIILIDDPDRIVEADAILDAEPAAREDRKKPALLHESPNPGRKDQTGADGQGKGKRRIEIISCGAARGAVRQGNGSDIRDFPIRTETAPVACKLRLRDMFEPCDPLHTSSVSPLYATLRVDRRCTIETILTIRYCQRKKETS